MIVSEDQTNDPAQRIFCALDTIDIDHAVSLARELSGIVGGVKLGLEFFMRHGQAGYNLVAKTGVPIFLDLKFHDIPNTVAGAIRSVMPLAPKIMTIHTQGGPDMMRRAADTAREESEKLSVPQPWIAGVTILTSLDGDDLKAMGISDPLTDQVARLAGLANQYGLDGMVCSPKEIGIARAATKSDFKLIVPGIRPAGAAIGDQKRVMTPRDAVDAGADILVIGRPITGADNPAQMARAIAESLKA